MGSNLSFTVKSRFENIQKNLNKGPFSGECLSMGSTHLLGSLYPSGHSHLLGWKEGVMLIIGLRMIGLTLPQAEGNACNRINSSIKQIREVQTPVERIKVPQCHWEMLCSFWCSGCQPYSSFLRLGQQLGVEPRCISNLMPTVDSSLPFINGRTSYVPCGTVSDKQG